MAAVKLSTEYDSEGSVFVNKLSVRVLNGLAKLTGSLQREPSGDLCYPLLGVVTEYLSVLYDHEDRNALITINADVGKNLSVKYLRDIKAQQGKLKLLAHIANLKYKTEISYDVPTTTLPKVVCMFPVGILKAEEVELDEERAIALNGFIGGRLLNGQIVTSYSDESATFKYTYKDEELTLVPSVSWPQLSPSLAFKRQFGPKNKLSYFHNFKNTTWSAVCKYKPVQFCVHANPSHPKKRAPRTRRRRSLVKCGAPRRREVAHMISSTIPKRSTSRAKTTSWFSEDRAQAKARFGLFGRFELLERNKDLGL